MSVETPNQTHAAALIVEQRVVRPSQAFQETIDGLVVVELFLLSG